MADPNLARRGIRTRVRFTSTIEVRPYRYNGEDIAAFGARSLALLAVRLRTMADAIEGRARRPMDASMLRPGDELELKATGDTGTENGQFTCAHLIFGNPIDLETPPEAAP